VGTESLRLLPGPEKLAQRGAAENEAPALRLSSELLAREVKLVDPVVELWVPVVSSSVSAHPSHPALL
jgi:hypothetical protein